MVPYLLAYKTELLTFRKHFVKKLFLPSSDKLCGICCLAPPDGARSNKHNFLSLLPSDGSRSAYQISMCESNCLVCVRKYSLEVIYYHFAI